MKNTFYVLLTYLTLTSCAISVNVDDLYDQKLPDVPEYWFSYIEKRIKQLQFIDSGNIERFFFLTDYHIEDNSGYSHIILNYLSSKTGIHDLIFGGDVFNGSDDYKTALGYLSEFQKRFKGIKMYGIRGNHDNNLYDGGSPKAMISDSVLFRILIEPVIDDVVIWKNSLYYYRDVEPLHLRYIYLDSEIIQNTTDDIEIKWLQNRIEELTSEWSIVIFTHRLFTYVVPGKRVSEHPGYCVSGQRIIDALTSIAPTATIIAIISGHGHYDYSTNIHGFWEISTTCDTKQEVGGFEHTAGTINEQAFDIFSIDFNKREISTVRIGRGENRIWAY